MPTPAASPAPARTTPRTSTVQADPVPGLSAEQQDMMRAMFSSMVGGGPGGLPSIAPGLTPPGVNTPSAGQASDPLSAMLAQIANQQPPDGAGSNSLLNPLAFAQGMPPPPMTQTQAAGPKPIILKLVPIVHAISVLALLAFFVTRLEPVRYNGVPDAIRQTGWDRWAALARYKSDGSGVQTVPFFYAFTTLQVVLHSIRLYYEPTPSPPSGILGMALPLLPPPLPNLIGAGLKYMQMGSAILDDLCVLLFAVGVVVWGAGLATR